LFPLLTYKKSSIAEELQPLESRQYNQMNCRKSAHDIVEFTVSLQKQDFEDFWLPCMCTNHEKQTNQLS
jgi:hypothetical protein